MTPVALQLYSVRDDTKTDFSRTVAAVAEMGYRGVELAGYGSLDAAGANRALRSAGLIVAAMHVSRERLRDDLERVVDEALLFGTSHVVCPWWPPEEFVSVEAAESIGRELDRLGSHLRERGLLLSFHNHASEFRILEGKPILSWIANAAAARNLSIELDVFWAHAAGYPPAGFMAEQGERVRLLHLKDAKVLGTGPVDFRPIFSAAESIGSVEWYIVEQEVYDDTPLASVKRGYEQMRAWGLC